MPLGITAVYNSDTNSPGVDLTITGAGGYEELLVERVDNTGTYPTTPVRGLDNTSITSATILAEDHEAPVGLSIKYRVIASDFDSGITYEGPGSTGAGVTSATVPAPDGSVAGDMNILQVVMKPYTSTMSTPTGWTLIGSKTSGTTGSGADTGSVIVYTFYHEGQLTGDTSLTSTGSNVLQAAISRFQKTASQAWSVTAVSGADEIAGSGHDVTATSTLTPQANDVIFAVAGINTNNILDITDRSLSMPNSTLGTAVPVVNVSTNTGDNAALYSAYSPVAGSTGAGAPSFVISASSTLFGATFFIRLTVVGLTSETVESASLTIPQQETGQAWIKSVFSASLSRQVDINKYPSMSFETQVLGDYNVLGRIHPVIITDAWGSRRGSLTFLSGSGDFTAFKDLKTLITTGGTLMFQTTGDLAAIYPDMYFEVSQYSIEQQQHPQASPETIFIHTVEFIEVDQPDTSDRGFGLRSYQDVLDEYATYQAVLDDTSSYLELLTG